MVHVRGLKALSWTLYYHIYRRTLVCCHKPKASAQHSKYY